MQDEAGAALSARETPSPHASPAQHRSARTILGVVAVVAFAADQLTKLWALHALTPGDPVPVVGSWVTLTLIRNPGAAFSLGDGATWVLTTIQIAVAVAIVVVARRVAHPWWAVTLGALLGGALGNIYDRLLREPGLFHGHVVDFIDYGGLFIGNVADIAIVGAVAVMVALSARGIPLAPPAVEGRHEAADDE